MPKLENMNLCTRLECEFKSLKVQIETWMQMAGADRIEPMPTTQQLKRCMRILREINTGFEMNQRDLNRLRKEFEEI